MNLFNDNSTQNATEQKSHLKGRFREILCLKNYDLISEWSRLCETHPHFWTKALPHTTFELFRTTVYLRVTFTVSFCPKYFATHITFEVFHATMHDDINPKFAETAGNVNINIINYITE